MFFWVLVEFQGTGTPQLQDKEPTIIFLALVSLESIRRDA